MARNDAHCHFFSTRFLETLGRERWRDSPPPAATVAAELGWDLPGDAVALADKWVSELDRHHVARASLMASVHGDEESVAAAVGRYPRRLVGYFAINPTAADATDRAARAFTELRLRCACLFPAMHRYSLTDDRVARILEIAAANGGAVFVHCGYLSIEARAKLGLPSRFDLRLGDPLAAATLAAQFPAVPVIIPHFGAGFFREALMAADLCANVYLDTSSSNAWIKYVPGLTLTEVFRRALAIVGPQRLLFGTDSSYFPRGWRGVIYGAQMAALDEAGVEPEPRAHIFGGNFDRLFPIT